jgi:hypothetical protein
MSQSMESKVVLIMGGWFGGGGLIPDNDMRNESGDTHLHRLRCVRSASSTGPAGRPSKSPDLA